MPTMGLLPWSLGESDVFLSVPIRPNMSSRKGDNPNGESASISIRPNVYFIESTKMWKLCGKYHINTPVAILLIRKPFFQYPVFCRYLMQDFCLHDTRLEFLLR